MILMLLLQTTLKTEDCIKDGAAIVIAHMFCASRDTRISYGWSLLIQGYFCAVQKCVEKSELSK